MPNRASLQCRISRETHWPKAKYHYCSVSIKQVLKGTALNEFLLCKLGRNWDDVPIPGVGMKDLDRITLRDFRQRRIKSDRLPPEALNQSDSELIELLHLREGGNLRRSAVLLFHPNPVRFFAGAFVKNRLLQNRNPSRISGCH